MCSITNAIHDGDHHHHYFYWLNVLGWGGDAQDKWPHDHLHSNRHDCCHDQAQISLRQWQVLVRHLLRRHNSRQGNLPYEIPTFDPPFYHQSKSEEYPMLEPAIKKMS